MKTPSGFLKIGVLGSGSGSNMQSVLDAIQADTLNAEMRLVLSDVADAKILDRAKRHGIPCEWLDCSPFKTKLDGEAEQNKKMGEELEKRLPQHKCVIKCDNSFV